MASTTERPIHRLWIAYLKDSVDSLISEAGSKAPRSVKLRVHTDTGLLLAVYAIVKHFLVDGVGWDSLTIGREDGCYTVTLSISRRVNDGRMKVEMNL